PLSLPDALPSFGGPGDHEVGPEDEEDQPDERPEEGEVERGVPDEGDVRRRRPARGGVRELQREDGEGHTDEGLPDDLLPRLQPETALLADLDVVVGEAHGAEADHEEEHEHAADRRRLPEEEGGDDVGGDRREDDHRAAHGGGAPLGVVRGRAVVADELAVPLLDEVRDEHRRPQEGDDERHDRSDDHRLHVRASLWTIRSPSHRSPASRLDLNTARSRASSSARRISSAAWASGTARTRVAPPPPRAPSAIGSASAPTTSTSSKPRSAASAPTCACRTAESSPSSSIVPRTAHRRPRVAMPATERRAAD